MFKLIYRFFTSTPVKIFVRIIASLASAIVVVSGYLFILNMSTRGKEEDEEEILDPIEIIPEEQEEN